MTAWEAWVHRTILTPPPFIEGPYRARQVSGHVFCVRGSTFASFNNFLIEYWTCCDSVVFV